MNAEEFKDVLIRLSEVNEAISKLDPSIRAEAFGLLKNYIAVPTKVPDGSKTKDQQPNGAKPPAPVPVEDAEEFFSQHPEGKPADNALLLACYFFSQYGSETFSLDDIRELARSTGHTIPERLDMTLQAAKRDGKSLFQRAGRNRYKPTVHGETYFKTGIGVAKGTKARGEGA